MNVQFFDVANYAGHKAFRQLRLACELYRVPVSEALAACGVNYFSVDFKSKSDIRALAAVTPVTQLRVDAVDDINAFHWGAYLDILRKKEMEFCLDASIFFQVMMEAVINDALGQSAKGTFADKWIQFVDLKNAGTDPRQWFDYYLREIYRGMRNKVVHPGQRYGVINGERFRFPFVHAGFKAGWKVFVFLLNANGNFGLDYDENWKEMCETIHKMPHEVVDADFPDMQDLAAAMSIKHLDAFNARLAARTARPSEE